MGILSEMQTYQTLKVRFQEDICFIQIYRPDANNTINDQLIIEFAQVLDLCEEEVKIVVLEGLPEVFCFGADFKGIQESLESPENPENPNNASPDRLLNPGPMYDVWLRLASGPYMTIAHVRGAANAGGIGFAAACDVVLCEEKTMFSLSELLFGLMPACVLPFLIRRVGVSKANYMTLMTEPVTAKTALEWGLADDYAEDSQNLLRKKLLRLRRLSKTAIRRYKHYMSSLSDSLKACKPKALEANIEVFSDKDNLEKIARYVKTGQFPWEG